MCSLAGKEWSRGGQTSQCKCLTLLRFVAAATQPSSCWPETSRTRKGLCTTRAKGAGSRCRIRHGECIQLPSNLQTSNTTMCTAYALSGDATGMMMLACLRTYDIGMWCLLETLCQDVQHLLREFVVSSCQCMDVSAPPFLAIGRSALSMRPLHRAANLGAGLHHISDQVDAFPCHYRPIAQRCHTNTCPLSVLCLLSPFLY